jgi:hypothetical protein
MKVPTKENGSTRRLKLVLQRDVVMIHEITNNSARRQKITLSKLIVRQAFTIRDLVAFFLR